METKIPLTHSHLGNASERRKINHLKIKSFTILIFLLFTSFTGYSQKYMEDLGRGLVAVRTGPDAVFISWRVLGTDPADIAFNLYRGGTKLNASPITGATNFTDNITTDEDYTVRPVIGGEEMEASTSASVWADKFLTLPLNQPTGGTTPDGVAYTYRPNDLSIGDLDGDGEYELILKWDPSNSKDNSQGGYTGNVLIDAYQLDGTFLWRIDLGKNIRAGAHYTQFIVYDLDSDGKAEVAFKTADGTVDGTGTVIGDATADYRNPEGRILFGPEYLTIFNGETGAAMATTDFLPGRGTVSDWGDDYGNRVDRFLAGVGYFDGTRPSLLMARGYYTRSVLVAWDWRNGQLTQRWIFDSDDDGYSAYAGQGDHSLSINDVDNDGRHEVVYGSMTVDDNGTGLYTSELGHGDALHVGDLNPERPGQEIWSAHESPSAYDGNGLWLRDAATGEKLWGIPSSDDVGRAMTADIDPRYKGYEVWGARGDLHTITGEVIGTAKPAMNFGIWWDGDIQRELLDGTVIGKWNYTSNTQEPILDAGIFGAVRNNGTKANPGLSADLLGDWREEVVFSHTNNNALLIFTSTLPTTHKFYTFMHDPQYRAAIAWQNVAYNQPPHTSFYVGEEMAAPPIPNIILAANEGPGTPIIYLTASAGDSKVDLSWSVTNITVSNIEVYRDKDPNPEGRERIASLSGTSRTYSDMAVQNDTTYYYWIKGKDTDNNAFNSNSISATPGIDEGGGDVPGIELSAVAANNHIELTWEVNKLELAGQEIMRDTDPDPNGRGRIASLGGSERSFNDNTVLDGVTYYYWLKATDVEGSVTNSNAAFATAIVGDSAEVPAVILEATGGPSKVSLRWTVENMDVSNQEVYRDLDADPSGRTRIASLSSESRIYEDTDVQNNTTYYYWIKAADVSGAITNSNTASATPIADEIDGAYLIAAVHSEKVLDTNKKCIDNKSRGNGNVIQNTTGSSENQLWMINEEEEGFYSIVNINCDQALSVKAASPNAEGANILHAPYLGNDRQLWAITPLENDRYSIVNKFSGQAVSIENASLAEGANVKQEVFSGAEHQQFKLIAAEENTERLEAFSTIIYPNPSEDRFLIRTEGTFSYSIYDKLSRLIEKGTGKDFVETGQQIKPGLYLININSGKDIKQFKLIKQ